MINWIVSYPKSGNTFLRLLLGDYFYSREDNIENFQFLTNIIQYPNSKFYKNLISSKQKFYDFLYCKKFWEEHQNILKKNNPFIKTHNTLFYKEECFTNSQITKSAIYIIRDPRNVFLSMKNYLMEDDNVILAYKLGDVFRSEYPLNIKVQHTHIGNWETNYLSWQKGIFLFPIKFVKYEDLLKNTKEEFLKILLFLKDYNNFDINLDKINSVVENNTFKKLSDKELKNGFPEASYNGKSKFFDKGPDRDFKKDLPKFISDQIESRFKDTMIKLNYL